MTDSAPAIALHWLTERPIAHRGLHDLSTGIVENTASAFNAALACNYAIETDLQISADGEAMVHHDDALGRMTEGDARLAGLPAAEIKAVRFKTGSDRILTLGELCDLVASRVTLVIELKSRFDGDTRIAARAAKVLETYAGPVALMSFDPALIEAVRHLAPSFVRGIVAERRYDHDEWRRLTAAQRRSLAFLLHAPHSRPHFVAYAGRDLPAAASVLARIAGLPVLAWTIRSEADRARVLRYADQVIFEGFRPSRALRP